MKNIELLLKQLKLKIKDVELFDIAFTHSSYNADAKTKHHDYERIEFLGDSILGAIVSELAFKSHKEMKQGELTKLKSALVSTHSLANFARELHFDEYIKVGNSFSRDIKSCDNILEDVFEAFIGALFISTGFKACRDFIIKTMYPSIQKYQLSDSQDYKSRLQEEMQSEHRESVTYKVVDEIGPAHDKYFKVHVFFDDICIGEGEGHSKKEAEQNAAKDALNKRVGR